MDAALFERLLNEEEGATLDFKRDQYPFAGADDEQKSELLKDILAFANAWRRADAYILIGVEEVRGGRSNVVGVTDHIDDHSLQQFVSHKTNRPPHFSYEAFTFDGQQVGVIKIDQQPRPFYLKADYGKLKKRVVYIRRGSSTGEADLDEVARMGTPVVQEEADLRLEWRAGRERFSSRLAVIWPSDWSRRGSKPRKIILACQESRPRERHRQARVART
jgi:predicted HTH transcriptional regulator